jgi:hypothetical protein
VDTSANGRASAYFVKVLDSELGVAPDLTKRNDGKPLRDGSPIAISGVDPSRQGKSGEAEEGDLSRPTILRRHHRRF